MTPLNTLLRWSQLEDPGARAEAAHKLRTCLDDVVFRRDALTVLARLLTDRDAEVARVALETLTGTGNHVRARLDHDVVEAIVAGVASPHEVVRERCRRLTEPDPELEPVAPAEQRDRVVQPFRYTPPMTAWQELLSAMNAKLFEIAEEVDLETLQHVEPERFASRWLGAAGASEDAIARREVELGTRLPADYRDFLLTSNGFRGMADLPHGICELLPVEDIGWMRDKDARICRVAGYAKSGPGGEDWEVEPEDFARTLLIGESDGNECILLLPPRDDTDWELWTYHPECGFTTGWTFLEFVESALEA